MSEARMARFHVFECATAPPQLRFAAQFLATVTVTANGKRQSRQEFEPIVFQGPTAEYVRAYAARWVAEQEAKHAAEIQASEARRARDAVAREERRQAREEATS